MCNVIVYASLAMSCIAIASVTEAAPSHGPLQFQLDAVKEQTVCPIRVEYDESETRTPRRIKVLKCAHAPVPHSVCAATPAACCRHHHRDFSTQCVELTDSVLVKYDDVDELQPYTVSVGCSCMVRENTRAEEGV